MSADAGEPTPILDSERLAEIDQLEAFRPGLRLSLVDKFEATLRSRLAICHQPDGDAAALREAAHALKSVAGSLGADRLLAAATQVEQLADDPALPAAIATLHDEAERASAALRVWAQGGDR
ncbi:MAG: Hpt domain-containing protein [Lysobacteraceae bacterium]